MAEISKEERDVFRRIRERHEDDVIAATCDAVLESSGNRTERD